MVVDDDLLMKIGTEVCIKSPRQEGLLRKSLIIPVLREIA